MNLKFEMSRGELESGVDEVAGKDVFDVEEDGGVGAEGEEFGFGHFAELIVSNGEDDGGVGVWFEVGVVGGHG